jgi:IS1 family transposase
MRGMNKLPREKRIQIVRSLVDGNSMRATARIADVSFNAVNKFLIDAGKACSAYHDEHVRNVKSRRVQCDEIWAFNYCKQKNRATAKAAPDFAGDCWTWTALDADSKLLISYLVGGRDGEYAMMLMDDLRSRLANRVQLTTDGHKAYLEAVEGAFGGDVDYAMLVKLYGETPEAEKRYSPAQCIGARRDAVEGKPDPKHISTSFVERQNLTMRMSMRRFTRLTNAFSKKAEHHAYAVALHVMYYNFARIHKTLRVTPAMAAGLTDKLWDVNDLVDVLDASEVAPNRPKTYRKRAA